MHGRDTISQSLIKKKFIKRSISHKIGASIVKGYEIIGISNRKNGDFFFWGYKNIDALDYL